MLHSSEMLGGKIALITGAPRGLGLEIGRGLGRAGCHVLLHGRSRASLDAAMQNLTAEGVRVTAFAVDLEDETAVANELDTLIRIHQRIDILVNNAGARDRRPLAETDRAVFRHLLEVNLVAPLDLVRQVVPYMPSGGRIINITSIAGPIARAGDAAYTATKGGLTALTHALAAELGPRGITVNAVAPGYFATDTNRTMVDDPDNAAHLARRTSLGRWGEPKEIAGAVVFLASPEASYITGATIPVDGGYLAHF